jgi:hypothetical protein
MIEAVEGAEISEQEQNGGRLFVVGRCPEEKAEGLILLMSVAEPGDE